MKIKQLEWEQNGNGDWEAFGFFGCFQVVGSESGEGFSASLNDSNDYDGFDSQDFASVDEAKAYCQSLLEKQVEGALRFVDWSGEKTPIERMGYQYSEHDYPEHAHEENGNYTNKCLDCSELFIGRKGVHLCKVCSDKNADEYNKTVERLAKRTGVPKKWIIEHKIAETYLAMLHGNDVVQEKQEDQ